MTVFKHPNPAITNNVEGNNLGVMLHVLEHRPLGSKDDSEWAPLCDIGYPGSYYLTGLRIPYKGHVYGASTSRDAATLMAEKRANTHLSHLTWRIIRIPANQYDAEHIRASQNWREREATRLSDGTYTPLPWANEPWFKETVGPQNIYPHVSKKKPGLVAFTRSHDQGVNDRHEVMLPGRFLSEYVSHSISGNIHLNEMVETGKDVNGNPVWTKRLELLAHEFTLQYGVPVVLKFAHTREEMRQVYEDGPNSCMSLKASQYAGSCHPVEVYAAGDLALAYIEGNDGDETSGEISITARALVWPEKKKVGRIYGDHYSLRSALAVAGYDVHESYETSLDGAKLLKIEEEYGYVMPYIDGPRTFGYHRDDIHLKIGGRENASFTNGLSYDPDDYNNDICCERCEGYFDRDDGYTIISEVIRGTEYTSTWCPSCGERHTFECAETSRTYSNTIPHIETDRGDVAEHNADNYVLCCVDGSYYHSDNIAGTYEGDEDAMVSNEAVRAEGLVWHEATSSYYREDHVPKDDDDEVEASSSLVSSLEVA